eukprot:s1270_g24.t1
MVEGFSELVQASGISVPARAKFVGRFLGYTAFGSLTFGLVCGQLGVISRSNFGLVQSCTSTGRKPPVDTA